MWQANICSENLKSKFNTLLRHPIILYVTSIYSRHFDNIRYNHRNPSAHVDSS